jgi:transcriptional regulator with XRE-family HTH domain
MKEPSELSGPTFRHLRKRKVWTRKRAAREAGVSPATIRRIEEDPYYTPHDDTLQKLLNVYGVKLEDVLRESEVTLGDPGDVRPAAPDDHREPGTGHARGAG